MSDAGSLVVGSRTPGVYGNQPARVRLGEVTLVLAWNAQGDATHDAFIQAVESACGVRLPAGPNTAMRGQSGVSALWLGPRSWLLLRASEWPDAVQGRAPHANRSAAFHTARDALNAAGGALFDVTASRVAFRIDGACAADVLASRCPLDFHRRSFGAGAVQQSLFGHVNALFLRSDDGDAFTMMVARSFAHDVWEALCTSSAGFGYEVMPTAAIS